MQNWPNWIHKSNEKETLNSLWSEEMWFLDCRLEHYFPLFVFLSISNRFFFLSKIYTRRLYWIGPEIRSHSFHLSNSNNLTFQYYQIKTFAQSNSELIIKRIVPNIFLFGFNPFTCELEHIIYIDISYW